jgi:hypothetical protein
MKIFWQTQKRIMLSSGSTEFSVITPGYHLLPRHDSKAAKTFSPSGEPEAPIGGVIKALRYPSTAAPSNAWPMKASNS